MTFEIDIAGRVRLVSVETRGPAGPAGGRFRLVIDGESHEVDARPTDLGLSMVSEDGASIDVAVTERGLPLRQLNELEWIDGRVWANIWRTDRIVITR